jgi:adenylate cyclase
MLRHIRLWQETIPAASWFGWSENRGEDLDHASQLAHKALALDDSNSYAIAKLCEIHYLQSQYDQAVTECERVVATNPNSAEGYIELADALTAANRLEEAVRAVENESRIDPTRPEFMPISLLPLTF